MNPLDLAPVIPVVAVDEIHTAVPLAQALARGGVPVVELTLRTPVALDAIRRIAADVPEVAIGAGTILTPQQAHEAADAGAQFLVSPGSTPRLLAAMDDTGLPSLPGVATVSEVLALLERGRDQMKFFPAEASGGTAFLSSIAAPVPSARFCPTGGISAETAARYLALPNVGCVGGSWLTPRDAVHAQDWTRIESLSRDASTLQPPPPQN